MSANLATAILAERAVEEAAATQLEADERAALIELLVDSPIGRRWLRASPLLDTDLADRLLTYSDDIHGLRRDHTLERVVAHASDAALQRQLEFIAAGPAASALWRRLAAAPHQLMDTAARVLTGGDTRAATAALYLLVLDPVSDFGLDTDSLATLALAGLASPHGEVRGLAAEWLVANMPGVLADRAVDLVQDDDERLRGHTWRAWFRLSPHAAREGALALLGDEATALQVRRSALTAYGEHLPTGEVADVLAFFVTHPDPVLALDAAQLMFRLHRYPTIAIAAAESPHEPVRELALFLLDPYRGSPAAGGSRPGDPTAGDIFAELARRMETEEPPD